MIEKVVKSEVIEGSLFEIKKRFSKSGKLRVRTNYQDDRMHGIYEWFYKSGKLWEKALYEKGVKI